MKKIKKMLSVTFLAMIVVPAICIGGRIAQYQYEDKKLDQVAELVANYTVKQPAVSMSAGIVMESESFVDIDGLQKENPDVIGFLEIPGTSVAYPVMKSEEQDYYIRRGFDGKRSVYGSIYMDNASYMQGTNIVLYGHNMKSGKMFGALKHYLDTEYRDTHKEIRYITQDRITCYEVCAVMTASAEDEKLVQNLIPYTEQEMENLRVYLYDHGGMTEEIDWGDQLITLITCEYTKKDGRLFVIGKLKEEIVRKE